jgi:hypothetical protein
VGRHRDSKWTLDTLKAYLESRIHALETSMTVALRSAEQAVLKAESSAEKRFESVNEFRNTLSDQQRNLMPRSEVGVVAGALTDKIQALEQSLSNKIGALEKQVDAIHVERMGVRGGWGYAVGVVGLLLALGSLVMIGVRFINSTP